MNGIRAIKQLSEADIKYGQSKNASWHEQVYFHNSTLVVQKQRIHLHRRTK